MNKNLSFLLIIYTTVLSCCNQAPETEISNEQKEAIIKEIELVWEVACNGIEQLDAQKAFSAYSTKENTKYLREGHLYESIEAAEKQYASYFANNPGKVSLTIDPIIYDILTEETVIVTAIGKYVFTDSTNSEYTTTIGYSIVWQKEEDNWKILNMHTSLR